jgi:hypothetical protein
LSINRATYLARKQIFGVSTTIAYVCSGIRDGVVIGVEAVGCKVRTGTVVVDMSEAAAVDPGGGLDMLLSFLEDLSWRSF